MTQKFGLTQPQQQALDHIKAHQAEYGVSPSMREMATDMGIQVSSVHRRVAALEQRGHIARLPHISRSIVLL